MELDWSGDLSSQQAIHGVDEHHSEKRWKGGRPAQLMGSPSTELACPHGGVRIQDADTPTFYRASLISKFAQRSARVAVIGLGHVGMPLAVAIARAGHTVIGLDTSEARVQSVNSGRTQFDGEVSSHHLEALLTSGALRADSDYGLARHADVALVAVPTPLDRFRV